MIDWWLALDPITRAATITGSATGLSAIIGFTAIFFQIGRQGKNAIRQNRLNEALKLKVQIYEMTIETSQKAEEAAHELTGFLMKFEINLRFVKHAVEAGGDLAGSCRALPRISAPQHRRVDGVYQCHQHDRAVAHR